jgi:uncharacterized protein YjbJ (UPF0337 family)
MTGKTDIIKGRIKEAAGVLAGDEALRAQGQADQAVGNVKEAAQHAVNEAKDAAHTAIDKAKHAARQAIDNAKDAAKKL